MNTKKVSSMVLFLIVISGVLGVQATAQTFTSPIRALYEKVDNNPGVNVIYMSKKMVELKLQKAIEDGVNLNPEVIRNLNEIIIINAEDDGLFEKNEISALVKTVKSNHYEQLIRMVEDGESLEVYTLEDKGTGKIKDLIFIALEDDEQMLMSISGLFSMQEIVKVTQLLDLNFLDVLNF